MKAAIPQRISRLSVVWLALGLLTLVLAGTGCGSIADEPKNESSRPWNSPEGYQNGALPSNIFH